MKLTPLIQFVKKQGNIGMEIQSISHQQSDRARRFYLIQKYADFLLKENTIGMVVPCDEFGNVLDEPCNYDAYVNELSREEYHYNFIECVNYRQAKDRVLFKGFKVVDIDNGIRYSKSISDESGILHLFWLDNITQTWTLSSGLTDIESLSKLGALELTETALKEIGLPKIENND